MANLLSAIGIALNTASFIDRIVAGTFEIGTYRAFVIFFLFREKFNCVSIVERRYVITKDCAKQRTK